MLLIPFVENAFKHGISISDESHIHIHLEVQDEYLFFSVKNSIHHKDTRDDDQKYGVGLKNVKRRLEILFPNRFELDIKEDKLSFEACLKIAIKT
jgi:sensor histidine kinase YesM